ncbi:hypothetical protein RB195_013986 [Necator americanus]|uniref:Pepsin inhibitor-3-like repeated domain protein n=1 Tax=Necator americanus TaxID=51031 RepID=A0ABR1DZ93_NECAM
MRTLISLLCLCLVSGQQYGQYSDGGFVQSSQYSYSSSQPTQFPLPAYDQQQYTSAPSIQSNMNNGNYGPENQYQNQPQNGYDYTQYDATTPYPQSAGGYSSGQSQSGLYTSSGNTQVSIQQYSFNNGDCKYEDGYVTENGQRRQATSQEIDIINQYKQAINDYMKQVNGYMGDWVNTMFKDLPFNTGQSFPSLPNMPPMPEAPCLCSPQSCGQQQQQQSPVYGPVNSYNQQGNQYQTTGAPYSNQYQVNQQQYQSSVTQSPQYNGRKK